MTIPEGSLFEGKAIIGVQCAPMSTGGYALLLYTADNPAQASRIQAGQEEPGQVRLLLTQEALERTIGALQTAQDRSRAMSSAYGKGN